MAANTSERVRGLSAVPHAKWLRREDKVRMETKTNIKRHDCEQRAKAKCNTHAQWPAHRWKQHVKHRVGCFLWLRRQ
eukprot:11220438-Lingulodinium_polyedra.AAC.1